MHFILYLDRSQDFFHNLYFLSTPLSIALVIGASYGLLRLIIDVLRAMSRGGGSAPDTEWRGIWNPIFPKPPKPRAPEPPRE